MDIPTLVKAYPRTMIAFVVACLIAVIALFVSAQNQTNHQQESDRKATAAHWASAGLQTPVTTLKDGGDKRTIGSVGRCIVTVEGFTTYTSLVVTSNGGNPTVRQEFKFQSTDQMNSDEAAYSYIRRLPEIATYCLVG